MSGECELGQNVCFKLFFTFISFSPLRCRVPNAFCEKNRIWLLGCHNEIGINLHNEYIKLQPIIFNTFKAYVGTSTYPKFREIVKFLLFFSIFENMQIQLVKHTWLPDFQFKNSYCIRIFLYFCHFLILNQTLTQSIIKNFLCLRLEIFGVKDG